MGVVGGGDDVTVSLQKAGCDGLRQSVHDTRADGLVQQQRRRASVHSRQRCVVQSVGIRAGAVVRDTGAPSACPRGVDRTTVRYSGATPAEEAV